MNTLKRKYDLALSAVDELADTLLNTDEEPSRAQPELAPAPLSQVLEEFGTLPKNALFLGAAYDGLPVLLNLNDPAPGPILVTGDSASGKTALLQTIARALPKMHTPQEVQFGVITDKAQEWHGIAASRHCMGIFSPHQTDAENLIISLADWAHHNHTETRFALLLIDNLEGIQKMSAEAQQSLRWLLLRGPNRRVWTFATLNAQKAVQGSGWMASFRTRLLGAVKNIRVAQAILPARDAELHLLEPKREFLLNENNRWVKFWIPPIADTQPDKITQEDDFSAKMTFL